MFLCWIDIKKRHTKGDLKTITKSLTSFQVGSCGQLSLDFRIQNSGGSIYRRVFLQCGPWHSTATWELGNANSKASPWPIEGEVLGAGLRSTFTQPSGWFRCMFKFKNHRPRRNACQQCLTCPWSYVKGRWPYSPPPCTRACLWCACSCGAFSHRTRS